MAQLLPAHDGRDDYDHGRGLANVRDYEAVYIFDTQIPEEEVNGKLERYHALLTETGAEITAVDHWGRRQLTYPINKQAAGYYVVTQFRSGPDPLPEYERLMKLDEQLLRYLLVLHEGEPTAPMSIATRAPRDDDDDDGDED
jgi:small subunit ribosomal protein S6